MPTASTALLLALSLLPAQPQQPSSGEPQAPVVQVAWERSLEDALWSRQQTGKPLLVCVNMDGEVFCEQFANRVYRTEEFLELSRGYVCIVLSPDRHTPMDYDGLGDRKSTRLNSSH